MAGSPSSKNSARFDAAESTSFASTLPAPLDWEVLSMSTMSASTLGLPPQKSFQSETIAEDNNPKFTEKNVYVSASDQETLRRVCYISEKEKEHEDMQALVGPPHEVHVGADCAPVQEEGIPALSSKKKRIRVLWWKHQVYNWQPESRNYSVVLSFALVAAVAGIAVIGHRLHREFNLNHQLRFEVLLKEEKLKDMTYQVTQMQEAMTGHRRVGDYFF